MGNTRPTQCDRIVQHMRQYGGITQYDALKEYGVMRLASRISELQRKGCVFKRKWQHRINRYGEPIKYLRYELIEDHYDED